MEELNFLPNTSVPIPTQGTRVELISSGTDIEASRFASAIDTMLIFDARWVVYASCGILLGHTHGVEVEMKPELFELMKPPKQDSGPHQLPPEYSNGGAAFRLVRAIRKVRPDLTIWDPQPWSNSLFIGASSTCLPSSNADRDGGRQPEPMIRLIIGSR